MSKKPSFKKGNPRGCVLECLMEWENTSTYANELLDRYADFYQLKPVDRGLAKELLFGMLRHLYFLDQIINELRQKGSLKLSAQCLLRLGLYQIFKTKIADHAAVNETVSLAAKHERGLVNAILRNAIRQRDELEEKSKNWPLDDRYSHPDFLIERWTKNYGEEAAIALCEWNNTPSPVYARIHDEEGYHQRLNRVPSESVQGTVEDGTGYRPEPVEEYPEFVKLPPGAVPVEWIESGTIYIQDPSTSIACWLLAPQPDEMILDACAAPGGKTALLASMAPSGTKIIATDSNESRLKLMEENFARLQVENVEVREIDWARPTSKQLQDLPMFDAILLDLPCSNTGVMRRRIDVRWRLQPGDFQQLAALQLKILKNAVQQLKPDGRIIFSTCSIDPEENRELIEASGLKIEEVRECLPWRDGFDGAFAACLRLH
ncbi:MAG: 16S rRNA (cytosine(967)-C(5))-methyltransferase RsmB [Verrucomicrobiales bacterium]|nr:16S rRNA (cytosine(967)-C(5))-methyltransferase RsmB [Verrucomicrobiales bacterium]